MEPYIHDAVLDMHMARDELLRALGTVGPDDWSRHVPYGGRTLHDLLAHVAGADQAWASAARGLLKSEGPEKPPLSPAEARAVRERAIARGKSRSPQELLDEMASRRRLLLALYELLEPRHLALALPSYGEQHNSVRERIWLGYHDRLHAADVARAMRMSWHQPRLKMVADVQPAAAALDPGETRYVIYSVDPTKWQTPSPLPGWSYHDLLAHVATGDWMLQTHLRSLIDAGRVAEWPDVDAGNAVRIAERRFSTEAKLIDEYLSMRHETIVLLSKLKAKHLKQPITMRWMPPPHDRTVVDYLNAFELHERTHRDQLRSAMKYIHARGGGA